MRRKAMMMDTRVPWSLFLPVTLAIVVGLLVASLLQHGWAVVFSGDEREGGSMALPAPVALPPAGTVSPASGEAGAPAPSTAAVHAPGLPGPPPVARVEARTAAASTAAGPDRTGPARPVLPGAIVARREGAAMACIHGSIALRASNGWQQKLVNHAPVPCIESASIARR